MFWLFNNNNNSIIFYQIHPYYNKCKDNEYSNNICYNFIDNNNNNNNEIGIKYNNIDLTNLENKQIEYEIKIKGKYISYINNKESITFEKEDEFISNEDNIQKLPMFKFKYNKTSNNKMPNILHKDYDFYYSNIKFNLYVISTDVLFVIEETNNSIKKYILSKTNII